MAFTTTKELVEALKRLYGPPEEGSVKPLKYVIYVRRSTDDSDNQTRSLPDQVNACMIEVEKHNLLLGKPAIVSESISAKYAGKRPAFYEMLADIERGKYDAVLAWHPDRLARNMKDAGEIIDMIDRGIIKNLHFSSFNFENSPSGLMHLGITFVIAKQYTDQLSKNILRGIAGSIRDGEYINKPKHGYRKDQMKYLRPDGRNFDLIKDAFRMRLEHKTLVQIANYLNENHYERAWTDGSHRPFKWTKQTVQPMLRDPIYAGVLVYGEKHIADLTEIYDFQTVISVSDLQLINNLKGGDKELAKLARGYYKGENVKSEFLRGMVLCDKCGEAMSTGLTSKTLKNGTKKRYFYYRCETVDCEQYNRSTRANVIVDFVNAFLARKPFSSKAAYDHYVKEMSRVETEREKERTSLLKILKGKEKALTDKKRRTKDFIIEPENKAFIEDFKKDLIKVEAELQQVQDDIQKLQRIIEARKTAVVLMPEFLELMDKIAKTVASTGTLAELDFCIKKIFSNFSIRDNKVVNATLSKPFIGLIDPKGVVGAPARTRTWNDSSEDCCDIHFTTRAF